MGERVKGVKMSISLLEGARRVALVASLKEGQRVSDCEVIRRAVAEFVLRELSAAGN